MDSVNKILCKKLFDPSAGTNNFLVLKNAHISCGNPKIVFYSLIGKQRIGKSTFGNIVLKKLSGNQNAIFFKEQNSVVPVTSGADYYLHNNSSDKKSYVVIDCEGSGSYNDKDMVKLYLLVAAISNCLIFNIDKSPGDESLLKFSHQIIAYLELLGIPVPPIYIIVRDANNNSLKNMLKLQDNIDGNQLISLAREYIHNKFKYKNYLLKERICFISSPKTDDSGEFITSDQNTAFFRDSNEICCKLFNDKIEFDNDLTIKEKRLNFLWNYNVSNLNETSLENFKKSIVTNLVDTGYQNIFRGTYYGYNNCKNTIQNYRTRFIKETSDGVQKQLLNQLDNKIQNLIDSTINEKLNSLLSRLESNYSLQENNYNTNREKSSRNDPVYSQRTVSKPYQSKERYYPGSLLSYCTNCRQVSNSGGCIRATNHTGSWHRKKERFLGIVINSHGYFTCCGNSGNYCSANGHHYHPGTQNLYSCCLKLDCYHERDVTLYKNETENYVSYYNKVYTMSPWNENMFTFNFN